MELTVERIWAGTGSEVVIKYRTASTAAEIVEIVVATPTAVAIAAASSSTAAIASAAATTIPATHDLQQQIGILFMERRSRLDLNHEHLRDHNQPAVPLNSTNPGCSDSECPFPPMLLRRLHCSRAADAVADAGDFAKGSWKLIA